MDGKYNSCVAGVHSCGIEIMPIYVVIWLNHCDEIDIEYYKEFEIVNFQKVTADVERENKGRSHMGIVTEELVLHFLQKYPRRTVSLVEIENVIPGGIEYRDFAGSMKRLMEDELVIPIHSQGTNRAYPPLPTRYRIHKHRMQADFFERIRKRQLSLHPLINIEYYFKGSEAQWNREQEWLDGLNAYLIDYGLPKTEASVWERSYEIMGDEKWIRDGGGGSFLQRVGVYEKLQIIEIVEPLMFALNPKRIQDTLCYHLIVENKTTFDALAEILPETDLLTLIYGSGKGFLNSITQLDKQLHMEKAQHHLYYFGDLDLEGITIWYLVNKRCHVSLALPFYQALLHKKFYQGKENQRKDDKAYEQFMQNFVTADQEKIQNLFAKQGYYPQEALSIQELQHMGRTTLWKSI